MASRADAVIVGGGPAGALAAIQLGRMGWHVVLIERGLRFRNKTCGHCLNPRGFGPLQRAGVLDEVRRLALGSTRALHVHAAGSMTMRTSLAVAEDMETTAGLVVERSRFDQLLIDHAAAAGVEVLQPASARVIGRRTNQTMIRTVDRDCDREWSTGLVIGADGVGSAIARSAGLTHRQTVGRKFGFSFDALVPDHDAVEPGAIAMFIGEGGYLGLVRQRGDLVHAAVLASSRGIRGEPNASDPATVVRDLARRHITLRSLGWDRVTRSQMQRFMAIGPMPWRPNAVANERVALIGDAAGYIEPFTGEGMTWAMRSAEVLTEVLRTATPGEWNQILAQKYQRRWVNEIRRRQRICRAVSIGLEHERLAAWLIQAGSRVPSLTRRLVRKVMAA